MLRWRCKAHPLNRSEKGQRAESVALRWLQARGLTLVCRNFRCRWGELDLVMRDGDEIVIVEVRSRRHSGFAHPANTVDYRKQAKILRAAEYLIDRNPHLDGPVRLDVVAITGAEQQCIQWVRDAFTADS